MCPGRGLDGPGASVTLHGGGRRKWLFRRILRGALVPGPVLARLWLCALHGEETTGTELRVRASAVSAHQVAVHLAGVDAQDHAGVIP